MQSIENMMVFCWSLFAVFAIWCLKQLLDFSVEYRRDLRTDRYIKEREQEWQDLQKKLRS
jgi:hypothetical protein